MQLWIRSCLCRVRGAWWLTMFAGTTGLLFFFGYEPEMAFAEGIYGRVSLTYAASDTKSTDVTGLTSDFSSRAFAQQYNLTADKNIYPNLRLFASGLFQKVDSTSSTNGQGSWTDVTTVRPYIDLTLRTPLYYFGVNYNAVTTDNTALNAPNTTFKSESYGGIMGWKPEGLPSLDMTLTRNYNYDVTRTLADTTSDSFNLYSNYYPTKTIQLRYQGSYNDARNNLTDVENKSWGNDIRGMYNDSYLRDRIWVSTYYDYSHSTTDIITGGQGTVNFQVIAVNGLFLNSDIVLTNTLPPAAFLTDSIFVTPTNTANNIGSATFAANPPDTTARNVGLQFATATEINTLDVWVYSLTGATIDTAVPAFLPTAVAQAFTWAVYTSSDNLNWQLLQTGVPAPYILNASIPGAGRFEITFPNVTTKYIKVVVSPLSPAGAGGQSRDFPGIYITELQAFISVPAASVSGHSSATTESGSLSTSVKILKTPDLIYNFSYFFSNQESQFSTVRTTTMSNQLSLSHQFSPALFGSTQVQRIDDTGPSGDVVTLQFGGQITAYPLKTLTHTLGFSTSTQSTPSGRTSNEAVTLTNTAELYRNITAFLNGGLSNSYTVTDQKIYSTNYNLGLNMIPITTLNVTLSSGGQRSDQSGGSVPSTTTTSRSNEVDLSYYPFRTLYLFYSYIVRYGTGSGGQSNDRLVNYGLNWSPFPGGDLIFNFSYTENKRAADNSVDTTVTPSARWNITKRTFFSTAYNSNKNTSIFGQTTTRTYSGALTMNF
jgi:hypothetical protein